MDDLEKMLRLALEKMNGDAEAAATLVERWSQSDSGNRELITAFTRDLIAAHLRKLAKTPVAAS